MLRVRVPQLLHRHHQPVADAPQLVADGDKAQRVRVVQPPALHRHALGDPLLLLVALLYFIIFFYGCCCWQRRSLFLVCGWRVNLVCGDEALYCEEKSKRIGRRPKGKRDISHAFSLLFHPKII